MVVNSGNDYAAFCMVSWGRGTYLCTPASTDATAARAATRIPAVLIVG